MDNVGSNRLVARVVLGLAIIFVAANIIHSLLQTDYWILQSWRFTSLIYLVIWGCVTVVATAGVWKYHDRILPALSSLRIQIALLVGLVITIAVFHYNSFVFGDGNLRIAQIAQSDTIFISPYEYGGLAIVAALFKLLRLLSLNANTAGVWGWRLYSFGCAALAIWGALRFARAITTDTPSRVITTAIVIFAGPLLMFFGYIGVEPVVVPVTTWFALAAWRLSENFTVTRLAAVWGMVVLGLAMTITTAFLLPAAVCVTIASALHGRKNWLVGAVGGLIVLAVAVVILYSRAEHSIALSQYLVMPDGKLPLTTYKLISLANISDKAVTLVVIAPISIAVLVLLFRRLAKSSDRVFAATIILAVVAGRNLQMVIDPTHGIVLDFPRLTAYLAPFSVAFAFYLAKRNADGMITPRTLLLAGTLSVILPFATIPTFTKIELVDPLAKSMALRHDVFYRTTGLAFRDAYFYNHRFDEANAWETSLLVRSPDFLNMRGCYDLTANGQYTNALTSLYRLVARQPSWSEPRALLATLQLKLGQPEMAKPHIDTCLMLEPHNAIHLQNQYRYFQAMKEYDTALAVVGYASKIYPRDTSASIDLMIISLQAGQVARADSLASAFLATDTTRAYPHLVKGRIADLHQLKDSAAAEYRRFLRYAAKGNPDVEAVGNRLAALRGATESVKQN